MKVYSFDPAKNKKIFVGTYDSFKNELLLFKKPEHFMRLANGFGMQKDIFGRAMRRQCTVQIRKGKTTYQSHIRTWYEKGEEKDFGHGVQLFLSVDNMEVIE